MEGIIQLGIFLVLLGFFIVFIGFIYEFFKNSEKSENARTNAGGIIFIGPIPIIFGNSKKVEKWMIALALIITIILVLLYVLPALY